MISKYNGSCHICGMATKAGKDQYDLERKVSFHSSCEEFEENQPPSPEQHALADKLGFKSPADWDLLLLPASAYGDPAWWNRSTTRGRDEVRGVPTSDEIERITAVRGSQPY